MRCALVAAAVSQVRSAPEDPVVLVDRGAAVTLSNGRVSFTARKADATISVLTIGNSPNLAGRGAYFAVVNSGGHDGWDIHNADFRVVRNTPDLAELSFGAPIGGVHFTLHYILRRGDAGFYVYVLAERRPGARPERTGQIRWSFYLNPALFNYQLASEAEQGPIPDLQGARPVQDATFRLKDGSVYTKYNYCNYIEDDHLHGLCGAARGSYGAFIITPSLEFLQAPTKQEITVHAGPIMHRFLASGHFEPRELSSPEIPAGWSKLCGPWMVYLDVGDTPRAIWSDAKVETGRQEAQWPYAWMRDPHYPLRRGTVTGTLQVYDNRQPAANALMVLTAPTPDWQLQVLHYIFCVRADASGHFVLPAVRPGHYSLFGVVPGVTDEFRKDDITVAADATTGLGALLFQPACYAARLWEIGYADRRTTGFRLSDRPRQYGLGGLVPANLTYTIGRSAPYRDWYYAQALSGDWTVKFDLVRRYGGDGVLTIGVAGQTSDPRLAVLVNGRRVGSYEGGNSSALYRSAILGSSYYESRIIRFPASLLHEGTNAVTLRLTRGSVMYDVVKLEVDDPSLPRQIPRLAGGH